MGDIKSRLLTVASETLGIDTPSENATFDEVGADSLDLVEMFTEIETEFDVSIPDADVEKMQRFGDIVAWLEKEQG